MHNTSDQQKSVPGAAPVSKERETEVTLHADPPTEVEERKRCLV